MKGGADALWTLFGIGLLILFFCCPAAALIIGVPCMIIYSLYYCWIAVCFVFRLVVMVLCKIIIFVCTYVILPPLKWLAASRFNF